MATYAPDAPEEVQVIPATRLKQSARARGHEELERDLRLAVDGEVRFDPGSKAMYAVDASNYRQVPSGVVVPRRREDVIATVAVCRAHGVPIVSRAGGTGLAGQTVNRAVIIDFSKYMNSILGLDPAERWARVEPGVICDSLAEAAAPHTLTWGPQPSTHSHCCFGGMLGNNACGAHAQMAGKAVDNTEAMRVLLYDGTILDVGWMTDRGLEDAIRAGGRQGQIYAKLKALRARWADEIRAKFPKLPRRVSGYNLDQLLPGPDGRFNVARALVGSEGTLVTMLDATVRLVWSPPKRVLAVVGYEDVYHAADQVLTVLPFGPTALEGLDDILTHNMKIKNTRHRDALRVMPRGKGWLFIEFGEATTEAALARAREAVAALEGQEHKPLGVEIIADKAKMSALWEVRESGLGATAFVPGQPDTWPGWEDSAVRPEHLGKYLRDLRGLFDKFDYHPALYGHFGMGCIHCRVEFDLYTASGVAKYRAFVREAAQLVAGYDGSLSGEHGDGQSRAELLPIMFGPRLVEAFREFKAIWDPDGKMNPGKIVDPYPLDADLRLGADYDPVQPRTYFRYEEDQGSLARATLRCVGIGKCRRLGGAEDDQTDVMCPSFMVTREEKHSTRGRAHLLHEMLTRKEPRTIQDGWRSEEVKEALDLCLSCKGCKGDCPVNVDMATYKAEFLAHYYEGRLHPRTNYAYGFIDKWAQLASHAPGLVNLVTQTPGLNVVAKVAAGMPLARSIPTFAPRTFRSWFEARARRNAGMPKVVLWADTFNNYFHTDVAKDAVRVLEDAHCEVVVPEGHLCCGRPLYDYGFLTTAQRYLERVLAAMRAHIEARTPIVVLEPSCASVFRDELLSLFPHRAEAKALAEQTLLLSEFLAKRPGWTAPRLDRKAIVQGHCHHKSVLRFDDEEALLKRMGVDFKVLKSGCCGLAGSFGFEAGDKYRVSVAEGERALFPAVREAAPDTLVIADGFSCKTQIEQGTRRGGLHIAQVLALALDRGTRALEPGTEPETPSRRRRARELAVSMVRAAVGIAAVAVGSIAIARLARNRQKRPWLAFP